MAPLLNRNVLIEWLQKLMAHQAKEPHVTTEQQASGYLTAQEVAERFRISTASVYRMAERLQAVRFGRTIRIPETAIRELERMI